VYVKVGDTVTAGHLLANQNTAELQAQFSEMEAGIDLQKAKLDQLLAGASDEQINTAQDAVELAQQTLANEYVSALNTINSAYTTMYNSYTVATSIQSSYFSGSDQQGIKVQDNKNSINASVQDIKQYLDAAKKIGAKTSDIDAALSRAMIDLNVTYNSLDIIRQQCEEGIYFSRVLAADKASLDTQKTNVNTALTNTTSIRSSIASYTTDLTQAENSLAIKKAPPRVSDVQVFKAQIRQAEASAENVRAQLRKKEIYAPISGIVTAVNAKVGSIFSANNTAISLISNNNFQIESYVPEINISLIKVGNPVTVTLDAYGSGVLFDAKVASIDPAETIKDGVSTYKVVLEFLDTDSRPKSGMTGTIIITTEKKENVIAVPQGIITINGGKKFVTVKEGATTSERQVETGSIASNGTIEIVSGLQDGEVVILK
jgi:multidrug resistance efflux pump